MIDVAARMREAISAINSITMQSNTLNCRMCEPAYPSSRESLIFYDSSLIKNDRKIMHDRGNVSQCQHTMDLNRGMGRLERKANRGIYWLCKQPQSQSCGEHLPNYCLITTSKLHLLCLIYNFVCGTRYTHS